MRSTYEVEPEYLTPPYFCVAGSIGPVSSELRGPERKLTTRSIRNADQSPASHQLEVHNWRIQSKPQVL